MSCQELLEFDAESMYEDQFQQCKVKNYPNFPRLCQQRAGAIASKVCSDIKTDLESWLATGGIVELSTVGE